MKPDPNFGGLLVADGPKVEVTVHCTPFFVGGAMNSKGPMIEKGFYPDALDHCAHWMVVRPFKFHGQDDGTCGDFMKGSSCPSPVGK